MKEIKTVKLLSTITGNCKKITIWKNITVVNYCPHYKQIPESNVK